MKNSPNPGNEPEATSGNEPAQTSTRSLRRKPWRRLAILFSIILLTGIGGASAWAWFFVYMQLAPLVQNTVSKALSRPVRMGKVESFSFNGMRFAATELPATATDTDRASAQAMEVKYNLLKLLLSRTVELDVTLVKPKVYIEQDVNREWIGTRIKTLPKGAIDVKLQYMRLRDAEVVLVPRGEAGNSKAPVLLNLASGTSHFLNNNQLIQFNTQGALVNGGNFTIQGESRPAVGETNLVISGIKVGAAEVGRLIQLPLLLQAGHVDGNLEIKIQPKQPLKFAGTATLNQVTARLPQLQKPFANTNGQLRFKGTQVRLEKITTLFGQIPALANGVVDTQSDINLSAQTAPVELPKILQAFDFQKLPVAVLAEVQTDLRVTGPLSKPVVSGEVRTTKLAQVDRLNFQAVSGGFKVVDSLLTINNFRATPTVGGLVTGTGQVQLGQKGTAEFDAQAINVPGDAIAKIYAVNLPVPLGAVSGRTRIVTALDKPQNYRATGSANLNLAGGTVTASNIQVAEERFTAQVQASGVQLGRLASVPAQLNGPLSGTFNLSGSLASLSPSTIRGSGSGRLNVAGGTVNATDVQLANGRFTAQVRATGVQLASLAPVPAPLNGPLSGAFNLSGSLTALSPTTIRGSGSGSLTVAGGTVNATDVQLADGRFTAQVRATGLQLNRLAQVPPQLNEPVSGIFNLSGSLASFSPSTIRGSGSGRLNVGGGTVTANNIQLADGRFTAQVRTTGVQIAGLAPVPPQLGGPLSGTFNVSGSLDNFSPSTIRGSGSGRLGVAGGIINATDLQLADGRFSAQVQASEVQIGRLAPVPAQLNGPLSGTFNLSGSLDNFSPATIRGSGSGRLSVAGGIVNATDLQLADGRFSAQVQASEVQIGRLAPVPAQLNGPLSGTFNLSGSLDNFSPSTIRGSGSGRLSVAGGTVTATDLQLADGRFQAVVEPTGVQLAGFSPDLRGSLGGKLNVSGSLAALSPTAIQASGQVNFSEGIALIDRPLTASFNWNGQQLQIQQAIANGFNANGVVNVNLANAGLQAIQSFDLNVQATDLNLQQLPATLPNPVNLAGRADFSGRIAGTPTAPNLNGELQLRNLVAAGLTFKPLLVGNVNAVPGQGVNLQLIDPTDQSPTADKIIVALGSDYRPVSFDVRAQGAGATGTREGEELVVNVAEFPIELLKKLAPVPPVIATQPLSGAISGNLNVNLNTFDVALNNVELNGAIFAQSRGDRSPAVNSRYVLSGKIARTVSGPQFQSVKLYVDPEKPGELQTLIAALEVFDLFKANSSFDATKGNLAVAPILFPNETLQTQLERLSEIKALEQQRELREAASPLPSLAEVRGRFSGIVTLNGSLASGISTQVNIQGENWEWGSSEENQTSYKLNAVSVIGEGSFQNGIATLLPLRIQSGDSVISYSGTFGGDAQSGQLRLEKIPIDQLQLALQRIPNIPPALLGFTGLLNATATLSGSINNPQARGDVTIDPDSNQAQVQRVQGGFSYANARLNFGSTIQVAGAESSTINGSIPYKLPVATVAPADNKLSLNINVQNQGLVLLNLLSGGQVSWIDGTGNVQLDINGIFDQQTNKVAQLVAVGQGNVENATLAASALPEGDRLTNVTGKILFDLDRIRIVDTLTGQFSGGTVTVAGNIPFYQPAPQENPLMVDIGELALNLKGLYRGRVQGNVVITGTALAPKIGGQVNLFDGQVSLAERTATTEAGGGAGSGRGAGANSSNAVEFNGLQLSLGKGIQITRAPILNFLAEGGLTINGPLDNLRPEGTIRLKRGQVNLFTTQFRLARSYEQTAKFFPNQGLDPTLDVRLTASVTESTQRRLPTDPLSAEISDVPVSSLGSVRTVDIQARVDGPASQIATNLELTSSPGRSQSEIVALLGGSFVDTLGRGDTTLGLANLAGSALLGNVQNIIGDALGLSEFRLFPTIISDDKQRTSTLGLAAEAGVDLTRNFSVSVSKILTTEQPFEYSLRYRLNEQLLLRGATNLSGESRAAVEYEKRF